MKRNQPEPVIANSHLHSHTCDEKLALHEDHSHQFACKYNDCGLTFTNRYNLKRHILSKHTLAKPFQCPHCKELFALRQYLLDHLSHRNKVKKSQCGILNSMLSKSEQITEDSLKSKPETVQMTKPKAGKKSEKSVGGKNPHYERFRLPMFQVTRMEPEDYVLDLPEVYCLPRWVEEGQLPLPRNQAPVTAVPSINVYRSKMVPTSVAMFEYASQFKRQRTEMSM